MQCLCMLVVAMLLLMMLVALVLVVTAVAGKQLLIQELYQHSTVS